MGRRFESCRAHHKPTCIFSNFLMTRMVGRLYQILSVIIWRREYLELESPAACTQGSGSLAGFSFIWTVPGQNFQLEANHGSTTNSPFIDLWCHPHRTQHLKG